MDIITNHNWRNFLYGYELTESEKSDFDWIDSEEIDSTDFIKYKNRIYSISEFLYIPENSSIPGDWDGYISDSYFSGVLIKLNPENSDQYKIATFIN